MSGNSGLGGVLQRTRRDPSLRRESDMMGFYVCITLFAALTLGKDRAGQPQGEVLGVVWGTTVGLALAHWFAVTVSSRIVPDPEDHHTALEEFTSQLVMALIVAVTTTVVVILLPANVERLGARLTAALFIGLIVGWESRIGGASPRRSLAYGVLATVIATTIAMVKWFLSY
jgi:hypothetical protein